MGATSRLDAADKAVAFFPARLCGFALALTLILGQSANCVTHRPPVASVPDASLLLRRADVEFSRGCYLCLQQAAALYEQAAAASAGASAGRAGAARSLILMAARERDSGLKASDALDRARHFAALLRDQSGGESEAESLTAAIHLVTALRHRMEAATKEQMAETTSVVRAAIRDERKRDDVVFDSLATMRALAATGDVTARYLTLSFECSDLARSDRAQAAIEEALTTPITSRTPLIAFRLATCSSRKDQRPAGDELRALIELEPRFHEVHLFLGHRALGERRLLTAEREFLAAADGLPQSVAAWTMLGSTRVGLEDYPEAAADFERALSLEPNQREAILNQARALTFAGQFEKAIAAAQRLIDLAFWYQADAYYWLALNEFQLGRIADADVHVREAKRMNDQDGDTARLVGLIAERRAEWDRAQTEFELAISRNPGDCESLQHLGAVHGRRERWTPSVEHFLRARNCFATKESFMETRAAEIEHPSCHRFAKKSRWDGSQEGQRRSSSPRLRPRSEPPRARTNEAPLIARVSIWTKPPPSHRSPRAWRIFAAASAASAKR